MQTTYRAAPGFGLLPCVVRLEGTNVLEGIRELIPRGATSGKLPHFLASLPERLTSRLLVTDADITAVNAPA